MPTGRSARPSRCWPRSWPFRASRFPNICWPKPKGRHRAERDQDRLHRRCPPRSWCRAGSRRRRRMELAAIRHAHRRQRRLAGRHPRDRRRAGLHHAQRSPRFAAGQIHHRGRRFRLGRPGRSQRRRQHRCHAEIRNPLLFAQPGLFLGVAIDGSVLEIDNLAHAAYYGSPDCELPRAVPPSAIQLRQFLVDSAAAGAFAAAAAPLPAVPPLQGPFRRAASTGPVASRPAGSTPSARALVAKRAAITSDPEARMAGLSGAAQGIYDGAPSIRIAWRPRLLVSNASRVGRISAIVAAARIPTTFDLLGNTPQKRPTAFRPRSTCRRHRRPLMGSPGHYHPLRQCGPPRLTRFRFVIFCAGAAADIFGIGLGVRHACVVADLAR